MLCLLGQSHIIHQNTCRHCYGVWPPLTEWKIKRTAAPLNQPPQAVITAVLHRDSENRHGLGSKVLLLLKGKFRQSVRSAPMSDESIRGGQAHKTASARHQGDRGLPIDPRSNDKRGTPFPPELSPDSTDMWLKQEKKTELLFVVVSPCGRARVLLPRSYQKSQELL